METTHFLELANQCWEEFLNKDNNREKLEKVATDSFEKALKLGFEGDIVGWKRTINFVGWRNV